MKASRLFLRQRVRIDARASFAATYRWLRRCGYSRRRALETLLADRALCWASVDSPRILAKRNGWARMRLSRSVIGRGHVLFGREMPRHLQIAWGRHVARLECGARDCGLWLRDLPLSVHELARLGFNAAVTAAREEMTARGVPVSAWPSHFLP
jgi:hypothetical protein